MKKGKQLIALVLTVAMIFSLCIVPAFADVTTDGIQIGNKYYTLGYILGNEETFADDIFGPADPSDVIIRMNDKAASFAAYLAAGGGDFDAFAEENPATPNPSVIVNPDGSETPVEEPGEELEVVSVIAINKTRIEVTFSNGEVATFTVDPLVSGTNTRTITHKGVSYEVEIPYSDVEKPAVEDVVIHNYRHISVIFNTIVDRATATNPANYYFEIVDGDVASDTYGANTLGFYNQLADIETATSLVGGWWHPNYEHITAREVNGKTVVDIRLPEDARFTNTVDTEDVVDHEQTLHVTLADGNEKALIKNTNVVVAVRNVRSFNGLRNIDTFVKSVKIIDEEAPELEAAYVEEGLSRKAVNLANTVNLKSDGSEVVVFEFNEPVFDAHDLETSTKRDVKVYINNKLAANTESDDLGGILDFVMDKDFTYDESRFAYLDVKAAADKLGETYTEGKILNVRVIGVTDLAGNIMVPSTIEFNVKVVDPEVEDPTVDPLTKPVPLEVVQIADNMFRIAWNVPNATGQFIIENADGEDGRILVNTTLSAADPTIGDKFYSYVEVAAVDVDPADDPDAADDDLLAYDGQDYINRVVRINNPFVVNADEDEYLVKGNNKNFGLMKIQKDILAPVALEPAALDYDETNAVIVLDAMDVVPEGVDQEFAHAVYALTYAHDGNDFDRNTVDPDGDYLPIRVSYRTAEGALRTALVTNLDVPGTTGVPGSIAYNVATRELTLDLSGWPTLLDEDGALVAGAEYTIEIPKGFFADHEKDEKDAGPLTDSDITILAGIPADDLSTIDLQVDSTADISGVFVGDMLYVSNARLDDYGYTSKAHTVVQKVRAKEETPGEETPDTVPQTSKTLIHFDSAKNEVVIEFKGTIKLDTLKNPANYMLNGKTLKAWGLTSNDIEYVQEFDGTDVIAQYAIFKVPVDSVPADGDVELRVYGVTNLAGGMMTEVVTDIFLLDTTRPVVLDAVVAGQRQIILTFDEEVQYREGQTAIAAAKNFEVKAGSTTLTVLEASVSDRTVTLNLGSDIPATGNIVVKIVEDPSGNILIIDMSQNKNPLNDDNPISVRRD